MKYLIIGLGIYGSSLARDLTSMGHEVIGADILPLATNAIKDYISAVYILDSTNRESLDVLPLKNVDLVIVAIGENFGASVKTVALLKEKSVTHIYARAIDPLHQAILQCFGIDRILTPEQRAAADLTNEMILGAHIETMSIDEDTLVIKMDAPSYFYGERYEDLRLERYGVSLIAVTRPSLATNILNLPIKVHKTIDISDSIVQEGDIFTCIASRKNLSKMMQRLS